ncbi:immunoglobulin-like domain-containing protein [Halarcobacter mediterraneus]|uniref:immunoglobulin-like domain-containing protein n=1 Tax=Halarcobacter mediterraneus TaxID=2023153 RepID=UPI00389942A0
MTGTTGGCYEDLDKITTSTTVVTEDTPDTTQVNLTATKEVEAGEDITYTASVANPPKTDLVIKLSNGAEITIKAGETSGSVTVASPVADTHETEETKKDV